ncbi:hypothetical protein Aduo_018024 [Ancylostoma duodenale]
MHDSIGEFPVFMRHFAAPSPGNTLPALAANAARLASKRVGGERKRSIFAPPQPTTAYEQLPHYAEEVPPQLVCNRRLVVCCSVADTWSRILSPAKITQLFLHTRHILLGYRFSSADFPMIRVLERMFIGR